MPGHVRVGGSWKTVSSPSVRVGGSWKSVSAGFTRVGGAWKQWYTAIQPTTYDQLESVILTGSQSTVTFSNLNSSYGTIYRHLQIRATGRSSRSGFNSDPLIIQFNSDTVSSNYKYHQLAGTNTTTSGTANPYITFAGTSLFGVAVIDIIDAFSTNKATTVLSFSGHNDGSDRTIELGSMGWFNTAAVNTIDIKSFTGNNWLAGSRFSLYGIRSL